MSYYVVTGSNGMIGGLLLEYLDSTRKNTRSFNKSDIDSCDNQEILIKKIDELIKYSNGVFHVGAIADTSDFSADVMYYNYHITKLIADSCFRWNKKLIFSSTQMTVGRKELGYPENIYGWSKVACEDYITALSGIDELVNEGRSYTILRYTNVYGPGESHKGKNASLAYQAYIYKKIDLWDAKRDFVYVRDVVDANIYAMMGGDGKIEIGNNGIYWVGSGNSERAYDFVRGMGEDIEILERDRDLAPAWFQWEVSCDSDNFMPGWEPAYNVKTGTKDYVNYLRYNEK